MKSSTLIALALVFLPVYMVPLSMAVYIGRVLALRILFPKGREKQTNGS